MYTGEEKGQEGEMESQLTPAANMAERTDATQLDLTGGASVTGAVEVIGGERDIQTLADELDATSDVLEEDDDDDDSVFHNRENALPGVCKEVTRGTDPISMASLALGSDGADNTEAVTKPARTPSPSETEGPLSASYGSADPLHDQSRAAVRSEDKGTPLHPMESEPQSESQEYTCLPTVQNPGGTETKGAAGLEFDSEKGREEVSSTLQMTQEMTSPAASVPVLEKEGQVNGDEKAPAKEEELVSESQDELEEDEEEGEEEEVTDGMQQETSSEVSRRSQGSSQRCSVQSSGDTPPGGSQKSTTSLLSNAKYNTVSYRKIRKGNTKQRIDEFESMMHL